MTDDYKEVNSVNRNAFVISFLFFAKFPKAAVRGSGAFRIALYGVALSK